MRLASTSAMSMPADTPAAVITLARLDDALGFQWGSWSAMTMPTTPLACRGL
jgi:hypothetical protein